MIKDLLELSKARLSALVVVTFIIGSLLAPGIKFDLAYFLSLIATSLLVASASIFNCILERDSDALMERTKMRPLVTGSMQVWEAYIWALLLLSVSLLCLWIYSSFLCFTLGLLSFILYVAFYTPMKKISIFALFVGAIPGALPPVMGWTHVTGNFGIGALILFWILFFWQLPHFISIALFRKNEYLRAGLKTLPDEIGVKSAQRQMLLYALFLILVSFAPYIVGLAGSIYIFTALISGVIFLSLCVMSLKELQNFRITRWVFWGSLAYLPIVLGMWVVDLILRSHP